MRDAPLRLVIVYLFCVEKKPAVFMWASASLTILITQGSIDIVKFHKLMLLVILPAALLVFSLSGGPLATAADKSTKDAGGVTTPGNR
jgi:hypothetical protein